MVAAGARRLDDPQDGRDLGGSQDRSGIRARGDAGGLVHGVVLVEQRVDLDGDLKAGVVGQPEGAQARPDDVGEVPGGLAVVADRFWRAKEAALALKVDWAEGPAAKTDSAQFAAEYRAALDGDLAVAVKNGDVAAGLGSGKKVELLYEVPHLAHAPMEPLNCTAHVQADRVDVWMGTQDPDGALKRAAHGESSASSTGICAAVAPSREN